MSQWGEQCDATNIESRMWPRACGGAERMWSAPCANNTCGDAEVTAAEPRLEAQRCHMVQRGIRAGPLRRMYHHTDQTAPRTPPARTRRHLTRALTRRQWRPARPNRNPSASGEYFYCALPTGR